MRFEKGKTYGGGRKKGTKNKQRLIQYKPKVWQKSMHSYYDQEYIEFLLENNLPLDEYIDTLNSKYDKTKKKNNDKDV